MTISQLVEVCSGDMADVGSKAVPAGFKQTEIGVIPQDWDVLDIREISEISVGRDLIESRFSESQDEKHSFPVYSNTVDYPGIYGYYSMPEYDREAVTVVGRGVGLGTAYRRDSGFGAIGRLIVLFPRCDTRYLAHFINERVSIHNESGGVPQLTGIGLGSYKIALPPKSEQASIANALSDVDALISELEKLIAKKQAIKTATMQQLLTGRTRLPQFALREDGSPKGYKQSELGEIPEDWETPSILGIVRNIIDYRGRTPRKLGMEWGGGNIVALSAGNVKKGHIDFNAECYLGSEELYKRWMTSGDPAKGDIAFTMEAPLGNVALIPDSRKYILSQRTILLQVERTKYVPDLVFQVLMSNTFRARISDSATGSTAQGIKRTTFEKLKLTLPSDVEEQTAIAATLSDMDNEIKVLEQRLAKTRQIKQGMMQELLTGKTRLVKGEHS